MKRSRLFLHLTSLAALAGMEAVPAQTNQTWNPAGPDDFWNTTSLNWDAEAVWTDNNNAVFGGAADTIEVTVPVIINDLTFNSTGYTISSTGAGSLTLGNDLASTITVTNAGETANINETFANSLLGNSTLTKAGPGTLNLTGTAANTYSGGTILTGGTLIASHEGALGTGPVSNNATLNLNKALVTFTGLANAMSGSGVTNVVALGTGSNTVLLNGNYSGYTGTWNIGVGTVNGGGKVQMNGLDNAAATINLLANATIFTGAGIHNTPVFLNGGDTGESIGQLRVENATWAGAITLAGGITGANDGFIGANAAGTIGTYSGVISETGGSKAMSKVGAGTSALTGNNTYSGGTRILNGVISAGVLNNTGNSGNLGTGSTISIGNAATAATLNYTGAGETTDRVINLAGTIGNATVTQSGAGGNLKLTSDFTATGVGGKTLTLNGSTAGTGEVSSVIGGIFNNGSNHATTAAAAFATALNSITVNSVTGVVIGAGISGTGIAAGTRVTSITGAAAPFTIGLSANTNAAGAINQAVTFTAPAALAKTGTGTWNLSGNNTYAGTTSLTGGILTITHPNALGDIATGTVQSGAGELRLIGGLVTAAEPLSISGGGIANAGALRNFSGDNTYAGPITMTAQARINSDSGTLTLSAPASVSSNNLTLVVGGPGNLSINGALAFGTGGVAKDGTGTLTLGGTSTFTGGTAINAGTLRLDYSTNDSNKLSDTTALTLNTATVELAGGTHPETVGSTVLTGTSSRITRVSGSAILQMNAVTPPAMAPVPPASGLLGLGSVSFGADNIATTDNLNANGILPWARFGNVWGANATDSADGLIVAYAGPFADVTRLGTSTIPNGFANNVRIINGGTSGNISLGSPPLTAVNSLLADASDGSATIDPAAASDSFMIGDETGGTLWQTLSSGGMTIGTAPNDGFLTTGNTDNATPVTLTIQTDSPSNPVTVNSTISNNRLEALRLAKSGSGLLVLNGDNSYTGLTSVGSGSGTAGGGGTLVLSGNNTSVTGNTQVGNGATLELRSPNALGATGAANSQLQLFNGSTLRLRADTDTLFNGTNAIGALNGAVVNIDVNQQTAAGTNRNLVISPGFTNYGNAVTLNVTGGNGYSLEMGTIQDVINATGNLTLNPTTANLTLGSFSQFFPAANTSTSNLILSGTGSTNKVTGIIANQAPNAAGTNSQGTGAVSVSKTGDSSWELTGDNTYTGATTVSAGTLSLTGNRTVAASGTFNVGNLTGNTGTLNISNGSFTIGTGGSTFLVGNGTASTGIMNQSGGNLTTIGNQLLIGNGTATGIYNLSGGTLTTIASSLGVTVGVNTGTTATFNLSGTGTLSMPVNSTLQICRSDNSPATGVTGTFTQTGGTATVGILQIGGSNTTPVNNANANATLSLTGGSFSAATFNVLSGANSSTSTITIGGTADVTLPAFPTARGPAATATLNFDGGTLRPLTASTAYLGGLTNAFIRAGGARFDVAGFNDITVSQSLLTAPASPGGGLTKEGAGTLTLTGANTYTGATAVTAGALALEGGSHASPITVGNGASLGFTLGSPTVSTRPVTFSPGSNVRISGTFISPASYTLMTAASFSGTPVLESAPPGYTLVVEGGTVLRLNPPVANGFALWASTPAFGLAAADQDPTDDPDNDGILNLVEYALNGHPAVSDPSILPTLNASGSTFVFSYQRLGDSVSDTTQIFQYGSDVVGWTDVIVPVASATVGAATITVTNGSPADTVSISIPKPAPAVTGRYFGRLKVTRP